MTIQTFATTLFEIEVNAHIKHLQTKSFEEHSALNTLYNDIVGLRDKFIEDYQGKFGIISGYKQITISEGIDMIIYLTNKTSEIESFRDVIKGGFLQQDIDDIQSLLYTTIYKLKNLK